MNINGKARGVPTQEEILARAQELYLNSWDESFSVEHLITAENELMQEYGDREGDHEDDQRGEP